MGKIKGTTKSGGQKDALDKFYTNPEIAKLLIAKVGISAYTTVIEPSAGNGSFSDQIPSCLAFDLKPESKNIIQQDWLQYAHPKQDKEKVLVIGNPPFGQNNSLALRFINHASVFADTIAFILPLSFRKKSIQDRINLNLHLSYEEVLPKGSFLFNGKAYDVPCVFQIWNRREETRTRETRTGLNTNNLFQYVKKSENPDAAIQRVGANAGRATSAWEGKSESSNYFVKFNSHTSPEQLNALLSKLNQISYPSRNLTVGPRSISKGELNQEVNRVFSDVAV